MNKITNPQSGSSRRHTGSAAPSRGGAVGGDADEALKAGLFYVACDLRELARTAPPVKAGELLALCRLVEAMATA